jgi:hypothetical protein
MTQSYVVSLYLDCPVRVGLHCPSAAAVEAFRAAVRRGDIWWHALPHNAELSTMPPQAITAAIAMTHALDDHFGLAHKRVLSQRDVPGLPRSALPTLLAAGVQAISVGANGGVLPPNVPPVFFWQDGPPVPAGGRAYKLSAAASLAADGVGAHVRAPQNQRMLVLFHGYGYGKEACLQDPFTCPENRGPDYAQVPGVDTALLYAW